MFSGDTKYEKLVILETGSATITRGENESMQLQFKEFLE
jgi:Trp operon repressor